MSGDLPRHRTETVRVSMRDGVALSVRLWIPNSGTDRCLPALLEISPYRKDDWRFVMDHQYGEYFAQRGFVYCRADVRGTGESGGIALDEYTDTETDDGYELVEWLAAQPWSNGRVAVWGFSYSAFVALNVAKKQPPHLTAIIPVCASDDRFRDNTVFVGGCPLMSDYSDYVLDMVACNALPPEVESPEWQQQWLARLDSTPAWVLKWLKHPTDDAYWRTGSLAPDYDSIHCAVLQIGGWFDNYVDGSLRIQEKCLHAARRLVIGPWGHVLPADATTGPTVDHLDLMLRFLEYRLLDRESGVHADPAVIAYRCEFTPPEPSPPEILGKWIAFREMPTALRILELHLGGGKLSETASNSDSSRGDFKHRPASGYRAASVSWGQGQLPFGFSRDMRLEEATIPTFTGEPLVEPLDIFGCPEAILFLSCSAATGNVVVRLCDVAPDGTSAQVTAGILNLTRRNGHESSEPLQPGEIYEVNVPLRATFYRFLTGNRIRLSIDSSWFPVVFPSPRSAVHSIYHGRLHRSRLRMPLIDSEVQVIQPSLKQSPPELVSIGNTREFPAMWNTTEDIAANSVCVRLGQRFAFELPTGRSLDWSNQLELTVYHDPSAPARLQNVILYKLIEASCQVRVQVVGTVTSTQEGRTVHIDLRVLVNGNLFFQREWIESFPLV